jgi:plastocyanin
MRLGALAAAVFLCAQAAAFVRAEEPQPKTHTVVIEGMKFEPESLTVAPGDTVVWVNKDLVPHTATAESGEFDSKDIEAGKSWQFTASKKGDFPYICDFHPKMKATLQVQ